MSDFPWKLFVPLCILWQRVRGKGRRILAKVYARHCHEKKVIFSTSKWRQNITLNLAYFSFVHSAPSKLDITHFFWIPSVLSKYETQLRSSPIPVVKIWWLLCMGVFSRWTPSVQNKNENGQKDHYWMITHRRNNFVGEVFYKALLLIPTPLLSDCCKSRQSFDTCKMHSYSFIRNKSSL